MRTAPMLTQLSLVQIALLAACGPGSAEPVPAPDVPWWVPAFYATTVLDDLPAADRPAAWISGHFHAGHDMRLGRTRWVANPVEGRTFAPDRIVAVGCEPAAAV